MKNGFLAFLASCWERAAKGSVLLTDKMSIILVPLGTVTVWLLQKVGLVTTDLDVNVGELISFVVVFTLVGGILLRLLMSPYLVWKGQNQIIYDLEFQLALPEQLERKWLADYVAEARADLSKSLAILSLLSSQKYIWLPAEEDRRSLEKDRVKRMKEYIEAKQTAYMRAEELSYLPNLRAKTFAFLDACDDLREENISAGTTQVNL